uniref:Uncharacterized protein n=1 Tax=Methanothermobacter thermautotrophicus TaxID=145262 RepID=Q50506_METTF|nr:unknown [Methanothermobacter thermautotrophicus]
MPSLSWRFLCEAGVIWVSISSPSPASTLTLTMSPFISRPVTLPLMMFLMLVTCLSLIRTTSSGSTRRMTLSPADTSYARAASMVKPPTTTLRPSAETSLTTPSSSFTVLCLSRALFSLRYSLMIIKACICEPAASTTSPSTTPGLHYVLAKDILDVPYVCKGASVGNSSIPCCNCYGAHPVDEVEELEHSLINRNFKIVDRDSTGKSHCRTYGAGSLYLYAINYLAHRSIRSAILATAPLRGPILAPNLRMSLTSLFSTPPTRRMLRP